MKKIILSGALAIGTMLAVQAQAVKFGVKGGLNISTLTKTENAKTLAGFNAGGLVNIGINEKWAIQPEVLYSTQGTKANIRFGELPANSATLKLDYINVPVMAQYSIVPSFYLEAGPQIGFATGARMKYNDASEDYKDKMKSTDFGIGFGFGYKFDMGLGVSGRYNFGLTKVSDIEDEDSKNSVGQVGLFYMF